MVTQSNRLDFKYSIRLLIIFFILIVLAVNVKLNGTFYENKTKTPKYDYNVYTFAKIQFSCSFFYGKTFKIKLNEFYDFKRCYCYYRNRYFFKNT